MFRVGVVGYSKWTFNVNVAEALISTAFKMVEQNHISDEYVLVSGLTNIGIPALAYKQAVKSGWKTVGIACEKAQKFDLFPVNESKIVGKEWGDESETFLGGIDCLIRIGGGIQSLNETKKVKEMGLPVYEFELLSTENKT